MLSYYGSLSGGFSSMARRSDSPVKERTPEAVQEDARRRREAEEIRKRDREEWEARLADHERLMREKQETKERGKEERRAQQLIRRREYQRNYYQNHIKKPVECERCKKIYSSVFALKRHDFDL